MAAMYQQNPDLTYEQFRDWVDAVGVATRYPGVMQFGVTARVPDAVVNGDLHSSLPGTVNLTFPGCRSDDLLLLLDEAGICCSGGSACHSGVLEPSEVLLAMGLGEAAASSSVRQQRAEWFESPNAGGISCSQRSTR